MHNSTLPRRNPLLSPDALLIGGLLAVTILLNVVIVSAPTTPIRPFLAAIFFLFCPGLALVRLLRLNHVVMELTLGVALSVALTMLTSELLIYGKNWNPNLGLHALSVLVVVGCILQIILRVRHPELPPTPEPDKP